MKGLILLSGGLDSSTLACKLKKEGKQIEGLFIDYGQKMAKTEKIAAEYISSWANFKLTVINIPLDNSLKVGCLFEKGTKQWTSNFVSFMPQRNLFLLTIAAMFAQKLGINDIYIGAIKIPINPFPDTTPEFFEAAQTALRKSFPELNIYYPFINLEKKSVALIAKEIGMPLNATFSCEMAVDHHCMQCPSCLDRYWALKEIKDDF
ncbi:MAG TPA: 7-cyano-7-deazaguanine synthase [Syntrophomonadaceae bacterium]|nr:7-cyano-7-deazaguanine synthase [Syntrophomonadaceae bacterium]